MISSIKKFIKRKQEVIIILLMSLVITLSLIFLVDAISIYNQNSLNNLIMSIFGTIFGLLLTSYAILFGLIPALSIDTLETKAISNVNFRFFISIISNIFILIIGFIIIFLSGNCVKYFIYAQLFLVTYLILMLLLLVFYLFLLFRGAKNKAIKDRTK